MTAPKLSLDTSCALEAVWLGFRHPFSSMLFSQEFQLPNGAKMKNRLCKAAMTEHMADPQSNLPNEKHLKVYEAMFGREFNIF